MGTSRRAAFALPPESKTLILANVLLILLSVSVFFSVPSRSTENLKMVDAAVQEKLEAGFAKLQAADNCKSLLKKYLTREVLDKTKDLKTSFGSTLLDVVQSGMENLDSGVGVYAPDAESYTLFHDLFDPIIEEEGEERHLPQTVNNIRGSTKRSCSPAPIFSVLNLSLFTFLPLLLLLLSIELKSNFEF